MKNSPSVNVIVAGLCLSLAVCQVSQGGWLDSPTANTSYLPTEFMRCEGTGIPQTCTTVNIRVYANLANGNMFEEAYQTATVSETHDYEKNVVPNGATWSIDKDGSNHKIRVFDSPTSTVIRGSCQVIVNSPPA